MKTRKLIVFSSLIVGILIMNVGIFMPNGSIERLLLLKNIESLANDENDSDDDTISGGELPEYEITCNSGGEGACYRLHLITSSLGTPVTYTCTSSGNPSDSCTSRDVFFANLGLNHG